MKTQFHKTCPDTGISGVIRSCPEDFRVDEIPLFEPSGQGEHVWLHIKKTGENTDWVAGLLAKIAEVPRRDVGYSGLKDRHAVTTQFFSVQMPGRDAPNWQAALSGSIELLDENRHDRKLRTGALLGNRFDLVVRQFKGEESQLRQIIENISTQGIPNYYGEQRFGHGGLNVEKASRLFRGEFKIKNRKTRGIYLSAARSWIFNQLLSTRVADKSWNKGIKGDVFMLEGSHSFFSEEVSDLIIQRIQNQELHPTGMLWGKGELASTKLALHRELEVADAFRHLCAGLENAGLKQERRALRCRVKHLEYDMIDSETIRLRFQLPPGTYATSVLSEIGEFFPQRTF